MQVLQNGQPTIEGLDAGIHLDSPTRQKIDLSGTWNFASEPEGWIERIFQPSLQKEVKVPGSIEYTGRMAFSRKFSVDEAMTIMHRSSLSPSASIMNVKY
jgi:hypothetical protein